MYFSFYLKKNITIFFLLFLSIKSTSQEYYLTSVYTDKYYYNATLKEDIILLGTSEGVFKYNKEEITFVTQEIRGGIIYNDNQLKKFIPIKNNQFNYLLPDELVSKNVVTFKNKNLLFLFSKGKLIVYHLSHYQFEAIGSTRSFSDNFIGTYNGIFFKNKKLKNPIYTSGYIREYDSETFICYDGLYRINKKDSVITDFISYSSLSTAIFDKELGRTEDILRIKPNEFLLTSSLGLYLINFKKKESKLLLKNSGSNYRFLRYDSNGVNGRVVFFNDNKEYTYNTETKIVQEINTFSEPVEDVFSISDNQKLILTKNKLFSKNSFNNSKDYILFDNLIQPHNVGLFKNIVYVTSNSGLNCYDLTNSKVYHNVIVDEFNKRAHYIKNDTLMLGSINGYYKLSIEDLQSQIETSISRLRKTTKTASNANLIFHLTFAIVLMILNYIYINFLKKRISKPNEIISPSLKKEIENYIVGNLNIVSLELICDEFNLSHTKLYQIMETEKPGNFIRLKRMQTVRAMRKKGLSDGLISKKTGFSVSYLKKI